MSIDYSNKVDMFVKKKKKKIVTTLFSLRKTLKVISTSCLFVAHNKIVLFV